MFKKSLPFLFVPLLIAGCATRPLNNTLTNLAASQQDRNRDNAYQVSVALSSQQHTLLWKSIRSQAIVGNRAYELRPTPLMTNRWEGVIAVPPGVNTVKYRYKLDYDTASFGKPKASSLLSREYTLRILDK
jgi:hypothetical protein